MGPIIDCYKKYAVFRGRARRKEFWLFMLFFLLGMYIPSVLFGGSMFAPDPSGVVLVGLGLWVLFMLVNIIPAISVSVRRLHDVDKSGWWYWIGLVPLIGLIILFFYVQKGTVGANKFGPDPLGDS
jgi:uncharacterized membrane protein YhaH (DUF805 family)